MRFVLGRESGNPKTRPTGHLGTYRALDGSAGAPLHLDLDGPHAMLVVGKRGYGKSYTLGVIAEELARTDGVAPVIVDPLGVFRTLDGADIDAAPATTVVENPSITSDALDPRSWCTLVGLSPEGGPGAVLWQAAAECSSLDGMRRHITDSEATEAHRRAAANHLSLADSWDVFDVAGIEVSTLTGSGATVLDVSGLDAAPMNAVVRGVAETLYRASVSDNADRLPWLLIDEAHAFFDGVAEPALDLLLTRGRAPGVSTVLATQRPAAISETGISQSDILLSHRLTSRADIDALGAARPTYVETPLADRMPTAPGEAVIVDDATETVHAARIRERETPHDGEDPSASDIGGGSAGESSSGTDCGTDPDWDCHSASCVRDTAATD